MAHSPNSAYPCKLDVVSALQFFESFIFSLLALFAAAGWLLPTGARPAGTRTGARTSPGARPRRLPWPVLRLKRGRRPRAWLWRVAQAPPP